MKSVDVMFRRRALASVKLSVDHTVGPSLQIVSRQSTTGGQISENVSNAVIRSAQRVLQLSLTFLLLVTVEELSMA